MVGESSCKLWTIEEENSLTHTHSISTTAAKQIIKLGRMLAVRFLFVCEVICDYGNEPKRAKSCHKMVLFGDDWQRGSGLGCTVGNEKEFSLLNNMKLLFYIEI